VIEVLKIEDLKIYYQTLKGEVKAVDGIGFELKKGEILGIAGESGCGKSTFGNSLVLLKPPMKYVGGKVKLENEEVPIWDFEKMKEYRYKKVSIIPQYAMNAMNPIKKIGKMIKDIMEDRNIEYEKIKNRLKERLHLVNLPLNVLNMYPIELSGGMKQRVVMVIATLLNPSVLIADEITSALDVSTQKAVAKMLVKFKDEGYVKSVIFITHDVSILYQIADSMVIMYAGKIVERGKTEEIINNPIHPYTKLLISSLPEVGVKHSEKPLEGIPGQPPALLDPPKGCRFKDRCPVSMKICEEEPPYIQIKENRWVACWREVKEHA